MSTYGKYNILMKFYIRRKSDGRLIALRYKGEKESQALVDYLNDVDPSNEYYYEAY